MITSMARTLPGSAAIMVPYPDRDGRIAGRAARAAQWLAISNLITTGGPRVPGPVSWRVASMRQSVRYTQSPALSPDSSSCRRAK